VVPLPEAEPNDTLDLAQPLALAAAPSQAAAVGSIDGRAAGGDVDWYRFTLTQASSVSLSTLDVAGGKHLNAIVSLYNAEQLDPFYPLDFHSPPYDPQQHRLLAQTTGDAGIDRELAPGDYFVAVSGSGNRYFNPFVAGSGYPGATGDYQLLVTATPLPGADTNGPSVLATEPAMTSGTTNTPTVHGSPLAIRVTLSVPLDPTTVVLAQPDPFPGDPPPTVSLTYNPSGAFGDGNDQTVLLTGFHFATDISELQLQPAAALKPGYYRLTLAGNPGPDGNPVLTDASDMLNLGQDATHPHGADFTAEFRVDGVEGVPSSAAGADDTAATAHDLGDLTSGSGTQVAGVIGNDPAYDPSLPMADPIDPGPPPYLWNPAADVDLYHFQISGPGMYEVGAEVFATRIGSTLDAGLSLFRLDPTNVSHPLQFVASDDNSRNDAETSIGGDRPLFTDPVLFAGLTTGDYYLAVSSAHNLPSLNPNEQPGTNGIFDPNVTHSGYNGLTRGDYVLNVMVRPVAPSPRVVSVTPAGGTSLDAPPTQLVVTFDSPVNVAQLASQAYDQTTEDTVSSVFIVGADGHHYFPRLESFDGTTNTAVFLMLDRLPVGVNELHLSGSKGLGNYGGNPLLGNDPGDPSGDYVVAFAVADPFGKDPLVRTEQEPNDTEDAPQDLGVLFPHELQAGVTVSGTLQPSGPSGTPDADVFTLEVLQTQEYHFSLTGQAPKGSGPVVAPPGLTMVITDALGTEVQPLPQDDPNALFAELGPGKYVIRIGSLDPKAGGAYEIHITLLSINENPPPLTVGGSPALRIRLGTDSSPPPVVTPPPVTVVTIPTGNNDGLVFAVSGPFVSGGGGVTASAAAQSGTQGLRGDLFGGAFTVSNDVGLFGAPQFQLRGLGNTDPVRQASLSGSLLLAVFTQLGGPTLLTVGGDEEATIGSGFWRRLMDQLFRQSGHQHSSSANSPQQDLPGEEQESELTSVDHHWAAALLEGRGMAFSPGQDTEGECLTDEPEGAELAGELSRADDREWVGGLATLAFLGQLTPRPGRGREQTLRSTSLPRFKEWWVGGCSR
jgi:hypothetical protein